MHTWIGIHRYIQKPLVIHEIHESHEIIPSIIRMKPYPFGGVQPVLNILKISVYFRDFRDLRVKGEHFEVADHCRIAGGVDIAGQQDDAGG